MLHPTVLGSGSRLFAEGVGARTLRLEQTKTFNSGIVILEYEPAERPT
jgi:hypothetical protein